MSGPEHTFQSWVDRFLDRVVLPPMFTTGIDQAQTDMAKAGRRFSVRARGVKFGVPDVYVAQAGFAVWIELKRGAAVTQTQEAVHRALEAAGQCVAVCRTMHEVLSVLREAGFKLHPNADALAVEYEARVVAKETAPRIPRTPGKTRTPKPPASRIRRENAIRAKVMF